MRTIEINKSKLWLVNPLGKTPLLDANGFDTGESVFTYSTPVSILINIYPSDGKVAEQIFGKDASLDMIAVSNEIVLNENSLLFLSEPTANFGTTYDYNISKIKSSVNTHNYGLRRRT